MSTSPLHLEIAIAATFSAEPVQPALDFWMDELDVPARIVFAPYNQILQQLLDPASVLASNQRGVNIVLLRLEDWLGAEAPDAVTNGGEVSGACPRLDLQQKVDELVAAL